MLPPPDPSGFHQILPDPSGSHQIPPDPSGSHQIPPDPSGSHQIPPDPSGSHPISPDPSGSHQILPAPTRSHQILPAPTRSHQIPIPPDPDPTRVQAFAKAFYRDAPGPFASEKASYVMAFSLMMLNTDAHNAAVRTKMTADQFIENNRRINEGADLPSSYLATLYAAVQQREIKAHDLPPPTAPSARPHAAPPPSPPLTPSFSRVHYLQQRRKRALASPLSFVSMGAVEAPAEATGGSGDAGGGHPSCVELERKLCVDLAPSVIDTAEAVLQGAAVSHLELLRRRGNPTTAAATLDWRLAVRTLLHSLQLHARHDLPLPALVDRTLVLLADHSLLPSHLAAAEPVAQAACYTTRSVCLAGTAVLLARLFPTALGEEGWYQLLRTLLSLHQLGLTPAPSVNALPADDAIAAAYDAAATPAATSDESTAAAPPPPHRAPSRAWASRRPLNGQRPWRPTQPIGCCDGKSLWRTSLSGCNSARTSRRCS